MQSRFFNRIAFGLSDCWYWAGTIDDTGYGVVRNRRTHLGEIKAHRFSFRLFNGDIPDGLKVCHRCDIRNCVNPEHLFLGTQAENVRDMIDKGRKPVGVTPKGEAHHFSILTEESVKEIRRLRSEVGRSYQSIANQFGVSMTTAHAVVNGRSWRHVK
jgi:hypothetical protein